MVFLRIGRRVKLPVGCGRKKTSTFKMTKRNDDRSSAKNAVIDSVRAEH